MAKLDGKIALITGGTTGIGEATARLFRQEGARVIVTGRNPRTLAKARAAFGDGVEVAEVEASDVAATRTLIDAIKERHGRLDIAFVNAGIAQFAPLEAVDEASFDQQFGVNVRGAFFTMQRAAAIMPDGGVILSTGSGAGAKGFPTSSVYAATKAALRSFSRTLAAELAPRRIRVNTISPGPIDTPIFGKSGLSPEEIEERKKFFVAGVPLRRIGTAEEVAAAALYLASDAAAYVTGIDLPVDGGVVSV